MVQVVQETREGIGQDTLQARQPEQQAHEGGTRSLPENAGLGSNELTVPQRVPKSIGLQLRFWFFLLAFIPLAVVAGLAYLYFEYSLTDAIEKELSISSKQDAYYIEEWAQQQERGLDAFVRDQLSSPWLRGQLVQEPVEVPLLSAGLQSNEEVESFLSKLVRENRFIRQIYLLDPEGQFVSARPSPSLRGRMLYDTAESDNTLRTLMSADILRRDKQFVFREQILALNGYDAFFVAPLNDDKGQRMGTWVLGFDISPLFQVVERSDSMGLSKMLLKLPAREQQEVLGMAFADPAMLDLADLKRWVQGGLLNPKSFAQVREYFDESGKEHWFMTEPVSIFGAPWALMIGVERSKAMHAVDKMGLYGAAFVLIMLFLVMWAAKKLAFRIVSPLVSLSQLSQEVAGGELSLRANIQTENEIGVLADAMNQMLDGRQRYEEALIAANQASEEAIAALNELKFALDHHSIVAATDLKGTITYANAKFEEISGYDNDELLGANHRILSSGIHEEPFWRHMYLTVSQGNVWRDAICNRAKDGSLYWVDTTIVPVMRHGKPQSYISIRTDITLAVLAREELIEAKEAAEAGGRAKSEFLASMSHEIRTPMNGVLGMLNLLKRTQLTDEQRRQTDLAFHSAESLLTIINDILDFSKIEAGKLDLEEMDFDLVEEISQFAEIIAPKIQESGVEFVLDLSGIESPWVRGDPGRLRQILVNLVGNAAKFTSSGEIVVTAKLLQSYRGRLKLECSVRDSGIGIPTEKLVGLFESFTQVDASTTRKFGGTGLGLTIVKQLCELMEGDIRVESLEGEGSDFIFQVFLGACEESPVTPLPSLWQDAELWVVDPCAASREAMAKQCQSWGLAVQLSENLAGLSDLAKRQDEAQGPKAILLDVRVFSRKGKPVTKKDIEIGLASIEQNYPELSTPIILSNPVSMGLKLKSFKTKNLLAYQGKPINPQSLRTTLTSVWLDGGEGLQGRAAGEENGSEAKLKVANFGHAVRILLVEDNPVNQLVASAMLAQIGLTCDQAGNGLEALAAMKQAPEDMPYHVVLMDCQMPEMDGYEASQEIRSGTAGERYLDIPIIAMTANAMKGDREKCLEAGMSDYISKPVHSDVLETVLGKYLAKIDLPGSEEKADALSELKESEQVKRDEVSEDHDQDKSFEFGENPEWDASSGSMCSDDESSVGGADEEESESEPIWDRQGALNNLGGSESLFEQLMEAAMDDIPINLARLEAAFASGDVDAARVAAHSIKGVAASLGAMQLQQLAFAAEAVAREGDLASMPEHFERLVQGFTRFQQEAG